MSAVITTPLDTATIIRMGYISSYLATADANQQRQYRGTSLSNDKLPLLIFMVTEIINWHYQINPSDPTLIDTTNYLLWLIGKYKAQALALLGQGGTVIIVTSGGGGTVTVEWGEIQFVVDLPNSEIPTGVPVMASGDTSYTLPYPCVVNSIHILDNDTDLDLFPSWNQNFRPTYGTNDTLLVFSFPVQPLHVIKISFVKITSTT